MQGSYTEYLEVLQEEAEEEEALRQMEVEEEREAMRAARDEERRASGAAAGDSTKAAGARQTTALWNALAIVALVGTVLLLLAVDAWLSLKQRLHACALGWNQGHQRSRDVYIP